MNMTKFFRRNLQPARCEPVSEGNSVFLAPWDAQEEYMGRELAPLRILSPHLAYTTSVRSPQPVPSECGAAATLVESRNNETVPRRRAHPPTDSPTSTSLMHTVSIAASINAHSSLGASLTSMCLRSSPRSQTDDDGLLLLLLSFAMFLRDVRGAVLVGAQRTRIVLNLGLAPSLRGPKA